MLFRSDGTWYMNGYAREGGDVVAFSRNKGYARCNDGKFPRGGYGGGVSTPIELSGGNNGGTELEACTGECDRDSDCVAGLKCFQRSNGEPIPGCTGAGSGASWDYCYDPNALRLASPPQFCWGSGAQTNGPMSYFWRRPSLRPSLQPLPPPPSSPPLPPASPDRKSTRLNSSH